MQQPEYTTDAEWRDLEPDIDRAWAALAARHPAFAAHERFARDRLAQLAHRAYQYGMSAAYRQVRTTDEAANELGVRPNTIRQHAGRYDIGWRIGRDWLFRPDDMEQLRRIVGRGPGPRPSGEE